MQKNTDLDIQSKIVKKSQLISDIVHQCTNVDEALADEAVREIFEMMIDALVHDGRIEVRGFGSFCLHHREARKARNPRTGEYVEIGSKAVPHFKPGKTLREMVNIAK